MAGLLEVRSINQFYHTHYTPEDLEGWPDVDVKEAIELANIYGNNT